MTTTGPVPPYTDPEWETLPRCAACGYPIRPDHPTLELYKGEITHGWCL